MKLLLNLTTLLTCLVLAQVTVKAGATPDAVHRINGTGDKSATELPPLDVCSTHVHAAARIQGQQNTQPSSNRTLGHRGEKLACGNLEEYHGRSSKTFAARKEVGLSRSSTKGGLPQHTSFPDAEMQAISKVLKNGEEFLKLESGRNVVLILWDKDASRKVLAEYINKHYTVESLKAGETHSGEFALEDGYGSSGPNVRSYFIEIFVSADTNTVFCSYNISNKGRGVIHEIASVYLLKRILNSATKLKIILSTNYPSDAKDLDKENFLALVTQSAKFISDINKFKQSVALIVSEEEHGAPKRQAREIITGVAEMLIGAKTFVSEKYQLDDTSAGGNSNPESVVQLLDALLMNDSNGYVRIGIIRQAGADMKGSSDSEGNEMGLGKLSRDHTTFVEQENASFRHLGISEELKNRTELFAKFSNEEIKTKMALVGGDILKFYRSRELQTRDIATLLHELQEACTLLSEMTSNMSQLADPKTLARTIGDALKTLKINIDMDNLIDVVRQFTYLEIFQIVSGHDSALLQITDWIGPVRKIVNEIRDSKDRITFLFDMREKLLHLGTKVITPGSHWNLGSVVAVSSTNRGWTGFLTEIESLKNISQIDDVKLNMLGRARIKIQNEKTAINCLDGDTVLARGAYVRLSEVLLYKCTGEVKSIEIFASDEVLVDADISRIGGELRVRILAPQWRLTGRRIIKLYGDAGRDQRPRRAEDGREPGWEGRAGKPGLQGGDAGSYFGISNTFIGGDIAVHSPDGGSGGRGQDGGNGAVGRRGNDAQVPSSGTRCDKPQSKAESGYRRTRSDKRKWRWKCFCYYYLYEYEFYGSKGGVGGWGVIGGEGGLGGRGGYSKHIKLHDGRGSWDIVGKNGKRGQNGRGGTGGEGGQNGNTVKGQCKSDWYVIFSIHRWSCKGKWSAGRSNRGQNGIPGGNKQLTTKPPKINEFQNELSTVINRYKDYLLSSLDHRMNSKSLAKFILLLGYDIRVQNTYDTLALVNEMQTLENRFYQRSTDVDFLPFYQSILKRIRLYAANRKLHENSAQYKKVLSYLYVAALSKIRTLRQSSESILVTNMDGYLDVTLEHIRRIEKIRKFDAVARISTNYKDKIDEKIISADDFINREVLPEIEAISRDTEGNIDSLLLEVIEMEKNARAEEAALRKKRKELENSLFYKITSGIANFIGVALSVLNPAAQNAQNLIGQVNSVSEDLALVASRGGDHTSVNLPQSSWSLLQRRFDSVRSVANTTLTDFQHQIDVVLRAVAENPIYLGDLGKTVKGIEERLTKVGQFDVGEVRKLRNKLMGEISKKEKELQKLNDRSKRDERLTKRSIIGAVSAVLKILTVLGNVVKVFSGISRKYKGDTTALEEIDRAIKKSQERFEELNKYEDKIQNSLLPMIRAMERNLAHVRNNLASQSKISLSVTSWRVQASLKEVKLYLRQFTAGFEVQERLALCVEKLDDAMTTLIDIYDRIEGYREQKELADYVADIASAGSDNILIPDRNLRSPVNTLEKTISINILLGQYENVVAAFKQWVFPFADLWLHDFNLPSQLMINASQEVIVTVVINQIRTLKSKLKEYKTSIIGGVHSQIHRAHFSSAYKSGKPFYVWDNKRYKMAIMDLLAGKEVVLKADILKGVKNNAVKFNVIEIKFKAARTEIQRQLDKLLVTFHVKLTHHGNSHYKCGNSFYVIRGDNQTIEYSIEKIGDGQPVDHNYVYTRLRNGDILLSPYAMWSVRLVNVTNVDFKRLRTLGKFVDLELAGEGQYVSQGDEVCNRDLQEYYELDESFSELDRVV